MFVAGHFVGNYKSQISRLVTSTNTKGAAIEVATLLICADRVKSGKHCLEYIENEFFS